MIRRGEPETESRSGMTKRYAVWVVVLGAVGFCFVRLPTLMVQRDTLLRHYGPLVEVDAVWSVTAFNMAKDRLESSPAGPGG